MNDISKKSVAEMIDQLVTVSQKLFGNQDRICSSTDDKLVARLARETQTLNKRRNDLMRAINERLGEGELNPTDKTYK